MRRALEHDGANQGMWHGTCLNATRPCTWRFMIIITQLYTNNPVTLLGELGGLLCNWVNPNPKHKYKVIAGSYSP